MTPDTSDAEPEAPVDAKPLIAKKGRRSFTKVGRELTDEEMKESGVQKMMLDEQDRLETEIARLEEFRDKFHTADKEVAVLAGKLTAKRAQDIIFGVCLSVGSAAIGYSRALWDVQPNGWIAIIFGAVLIVCGIIAKALRS